MTRNRNRVRDWAWHSLGTNPRAGLAYRVPRGFEPEGEASSAVSCLQRKQIPPSTSSLPTAPHHLSALESDTPLLLLFEKASIDSKE